MKFLRGINGALASFIGSVLTITLQAGGYIDINGTRIYVLTTAITANSTLTSSPVGSLAITSNATGRRSIFTSDGTKWQYLTNS